MVSGQWSVVSGFRSLVFGFWLWCEVLIPKTINQKPKTKDLEPTDY